MPAPNQQEYIDKRYYSNNNINTGVNSILKTVNTVSGALASLAVLAGVGAFVYNKVTDITRHATNNSYLDITKMLTVDPISIMSKDLLTIDILSELNLLSLNLFSGYYMQAVDALNKIKHIEVIRILDSLNPNRNSTGFLLSNKDNAYPLPLERRLGFSRESYSNATLLSENYKYKLPYNTPSVSLESEKLESTAIFVGKTLKLEIEVSDGKEGHRSVDVPITVKLQCMNVSNSTITEMLVGDDRSSFTGIKSLFDSALDLIFARDIIKNRKKIMASTDGHVLRELQKRSASAKGYGLLTNNPSLAEITNTYVISEAVVKDIETRLGGRLTSPIVREKLFKDNLAMIIIAVDRTYERINLYIKDSATHSELSFKELKSKSKNDNNSGAFLLDIMKAMTQGNGAGF